MLKHTITMTLFVLIFVSAYAQSNLPTDGLKHHFTFDNANNLTAAVIGNNLVLDALENITPSAVSAEGYSSSDGAVYVGMGSFYRLDLDFEPNGPDTASRVNQFALVIDFKIPESGVWYCFHATDNDGDPTKSDWESFIKSSGGVGVGTTGYSYYTVKPNEWYRLIINADLGNSYKYYLDGQLLHDGGAQVADGRLSLPSVDGANQLLLFGDNDGEDAPIYISQLGIFDRTLTEQEISDMDGWNHFIYSQYAVGSWFFDNKDSLGLAKTGHDLDFVGSVISSAGPEDNENDYAVNIPAGSYLIATHDIRANDGGERVNQYTIEADIKIPELGKTYSIYQTDVTNSNNAELFINSEGKIGNDEIGYTNFALAADEWYKVVISVDLGNNYQIYVDSDSLFNAGELDLDGRYSLDPFNANNKVLFFADNDGEDSQLDVAYLALYNRALSSENILGLGGYEHGAENTEVTGALKAVYFNGNANTNKYAIISKSSGDFDFGTGDFTIELWTKPDVSYDSDPALLSDKDWGSGGNPGWVLSIRGTDWKFNMADDAKNRYDISAPNISDGNWHHLAVIVRRDSGAITITDDIVSALNTGSESFFKVGNTNSSYPLCIAQDGTQNYSDAPCAPAQVDEIRIWKGVAIEPEVIQSWRSKKVTSEHPYYNYLVGYWDCDEIEGTVIKDVSGRGNDAEMIGSPKKVISYAPVNGNLIEGYGNDVDASWGAAVTGKSGGLVISGDFPITGQYGLNYSIRTLNKISSEEEVSSDKDDNPYIVTGHNGKENLSKSGISGGVEARLNRVWSVDFTEEAATSVKVSFVLSEMGGSGNAGAAANYVLMMGDGTTFGSLLTATTVKSDTIEFTLPSVMDGLFTLGTTSLSASPLGGLTVVGVTEETELPTEYSLSNNYPNPFNPSTNIKFSLPVKSAVNLEVYNIIGQKVATLINNEMEAGYHAVEFSTNSNGSTLSSGVYIYRLTASGSNGKNFIQSKKMMFLK